jgi:hypothetical protein
MAVAAHDLTAGESGSATAQATDIDTIAPAPDLVSAAGPAAGPGPESAPGPGSGPAATSALPDTTGSYSSRLTAALLGNGDLGCATRPR